MKNRDEIVNELIKIGGSLLAKDAGQNPYSVPNGYFETITSNLMLAVKASADYQTATEELATLSPFLKNLEKTNAFEIPPQYFETVSFSSQKTSAKIIPLTSKKWFRFAAAAVVSGLVMISGLQFLSKNNVNPVAAPHNWVEQKMKKVSTEEINNFIKLTEAEMNTKENIALADNTTDLELLLKDVSNKEIQQFFDETNFTEESIMK